MEDIEDWRRKDECRPFEDSDGNLCITVKSAYDSFGGEQDARLKEAKEYGIDRLIRFYGKVYLSKVSELNRDIIDIVLPQIGAPPTPTELYNAAEVADSFISPRSCVKMKVLVKIPKETFDKHTANNSSCDVNKPTDYLSALISVENYERDIDYVTTSMEDFLPKMAKADKYIDNINIAEEIKNLRRAKRVIRRYFNLNSVSATAIKEEECEVDKESQMEIGFSNDYKPVFALIDGNKHTIGYDCFLEASKLNHRTTANYLIQLGSMTTELRNQLSLDFDIFQFLTQYTYPTPVVETKNNTLDGLPKYDSNGNLFSFANLAKLITLDLDKKSCKDVNDLESENRIILDGATRRNIAETARQSREFVGNSTLSESEGWKDLERTGRTASYYARQDLPHEFLSFRGQRQIDKIYNDVLNKIDFNCVLEESLKCSLEAAITRLGEEAFNDPDLSEFFNADGVIEVFGFGGCGDDENCANELQLKVGLPAFQGIKIPNDFPTVDYLAKAMDAALNKLYDVLIDAIVSFINGIFELMCKVVSELPDGAAIGSMFGDGFKSWLSKTIGVDVSSLADEKAWADASITAGGTGFMGVVGSFSAKMAGSWDALVQDTGISLNLPNPNTGNVETVFISPELIYQTMSGIKRATEDLEANLTPEENKSIYKGSAPEIVVATAYECLNSGNPEMFESPEDVTNLFSYLGKIVDGNFLENPTTTPFSVPNVCQLGDGTEQDQMAKNYLISKDPLLSDSEIEELLSKEKNRLIEKVKKIHKLLKSFQDGSIFPDFPSLFGSDGSLIPETPPIISSAMKTVSEGMYASTINNFNVSTLQYAPLWTGSVDFSTDGSLQSFAELSQKLMIDDPSKTLQSLKLNLIVDDNVTEIGYRIHENVPEDKLVSTVIEYDEKSIGTYDWTEDDKLNNFDAGKYTSEGTNFQGEDDERFAGMLEAAGIWVPPFSWMNEFKEWFLPADADWKDWLKLILTIVLSIAVICVGALLLTGGALGGWLVILSIMGVLAAAGLISPGIHLITTVLFEKIEVVANLAKDGIEWAKGLFVNNEITEEAIICIYENGYIDDAEWNDIKANMDEVIEVTNRTLIMAQMGKISNIADYLEDDDPSENGNHTRAFYINGMLDQNSDVLFDGIPLTTLAEDNRIELVLNTNTSGIGSTEKNRIDTKAFIRVTPNTSEETILERPDGFSEVITSFERRGVRKGEGYDTTSFQDLQDSGISFAPTTQDLADSGIELVEYDRVKSQISNYYMENESSLLLGRKVAMPDLLETRYSSTIDAPDESGLDLLEVQIEEESDLQKYHKRFIEIMEQADGQEGAWQAMNTDSLKILFNKIWLTCMTNMAERVHHNRMYLNEYIEALELEYPKQDILGYDKVTKDSVDLTNSIMKLEFSNSDYCDTLTALRRSGSITGLRLIIRTFIVERVVNSIQVFDTFDVGFMTSDMFKKAVFDDIKVEMNKYYQSFATTLEGKIFSDMKATASKYFEIEELLGNEIPDINSDKDAILEIIRMEIDDISTTIASQIKLDTLYHSSTWDDFVFDVLLSYGVFKSGEFGTASPRNEEFQSVLYPYFEAKTELIEIDEDTTRYVASILYDNSNGNGITVISAECEGPPPEGTSDECEPVGDFSKVKTLLFNNEIYQDLVSYVFPLKDAATLLSTYHLSAITDPAVFSATVDGKHITDLFSETKISALQSFLVCIHGAGETAYIDPFLEKLKT